MKKNVNTCISDLQGVTVQESGKPLTVGSVLTTALLSLSENDTNGDEKAKRYKLAMRIAKSDDGIVDLTVEELSLVKQLVGKMYAPLVVGQVYEWSDS